MNSFTIAWSGSFSSMLASRMFGVTYPLLALALSGSAAQAGWVGFAWALPSVLFYTLAGALVDRWDYRAIMLVADTIRAVAVSGLALLLILHNLTFPNLIVVAFIEGALSVFHGLAIAAALPFLANHLLVREKPPGSRHRKSKPPMSDPRLHRGVSQHETGTHVAVLAGRPLGGLMFGLSQWLPFLAGVLLFVFSFLAVVFLPRDARPRQRDQRHLAAEIREGWRALWDLVPLRAATLTTALTNVVFHALILIFLAAAAARLSSAAIGIVVALTGIGGAIASVVHRPAQYFARLIFGVPPEVKPMVPGPTSGRRWPRVAMMLVHMWCWVIALLPSFLWEPSGWTFAFALILMGWMGGLSNVYIRLLVAERVMPAMVGRVVSASRLVGSSAIALGPLLGGLLITNLGAQQAVACLLALMVLVATIATSVRRIRQSFFLTSDGRPEVELDAMKVTENL
ncbi:MFS transporter [Streptosporangiaceae bacterium NEAU-GS5]|nr:MFS transporter [Streptosporangiaceae bacterium NEAU-GS5]